MKNSRLAGKSYPRQSNKNPVLIQQRHGMHTYVQADAFKMHSICSEENNISMLFLITISLIFETASCYCDTEALHTFQNWITLFSEP